MKALPLKLLFLLLLTIGSYASATIVVVGSSTAYATNDGDWLSNTVNDIDGNGLGTEAFIFFGDHLNNGQSGGNPFGTNIQSTSSVVTGFAAGADFTNVAEGFGGYGSLDSAVTLDGTDAVAGFALSTTGPGGVGATPNEIVSFTIANLNPGDTLRVGIVAGIEGNNDGRWDPTSITLSDGTLSATVGGTASTADFLPNAEPENHGWVFFDVTANGTYGVSTTRRNAGSQGSGIGGITFDLIPEPSSVLLLFGLGLFGFMARKKRAIS